MPGIGAFVSPGRSLDSALDRARLADELGFDGVYTTHIAGRDSLTVLALFASVTERVRLGTGVVPIFSRTPAAMAQTAATIDEFSGGRMVLGLGVLHKITVENWYGAKIEKPVAQMREYASIVRAILQGEAPPDGEFFNTHFQFMGTPRGPTCRSTSPPSPPTCSAWPARSATGCCSGSATPTTSATWSSPR